MQKIIHSVKLDITHASKLDDAVQAFTICGEPLVVGVSRSMNAEFVTCPLCKARLALRIINAYNSIHNDLEAYLDCIADWGTGEREDMPKPRDFGIE